jgi:hypothetical protein
MTWPIEVTIPGGHFTLTLQYDAFAGLGRQKAMLAPLVW